MLGDLTAAVVLGGSLWCSTACALDSFDGSLGVLDPLVSMLSGLASLAREDEGREWPKPVCIVANPIVVG